ncbi:helix-turn-helix domain-containing protein [Pseudomonas chlororaphis]|uniref:PucR family transcriptional regulator n=1 Tax=Pseudomonas chlororaphis TaxID=587753 RepID=UPI0018E981F7|nr:helix-turn-helix domain-containing protein [Pseudomonas chlororaphis]MBP5078653.1 helix-turn-helix domain-containing protein [Pseudomonas chlororaphis]
MSNARGANILVTAPQISPQLRQITQEIANSPTSITGKIHLVLTRMDGYTDLTTEARKDLEDSLDFVARLWCESLLTSQCLSNESRNALEEIGRRRFHQGVPLPSLMRGFSLGLREIWLGFLDRAKDDNDLLKEMLFNISSFMLVYFDEVTEEILQAYLNEQIQNTRWRESLNQRLYHILFHSPQDMEGFQEILLALGLDPSAPWVALALDVLLQTEQPSLRESELDRLLLSVSRNFKIPAKELVRTWYHDKLIIWMPRVHGETISQCDQRIAKSATSLFPLIPNLKRVGIGLMNQGISGWISSASEAIKAIDFYPNDDSGIRIRRYSSILIEDSVRGSENILRFLVSLIEQLANEPELLLTLETYFLQSRRRTPTAKYLGIHPNTLNYRLGRIESILCASLDDINWVSRLDIALKLRRHSLNKSIKE